MWASCHLSVLSVCGACSHCLARKLRQERNACVLNYEVRDRQLLNGVSILSEHSQAGLSRGDRMGLRAAVAVSLHWPFVKLRLVRAHSFVLPHRKRCSMQRTPWRQRARWRGWWHSSKKSWNASTTGESAPRGTRQAGHHDRVVVSSSVGGRGALAASSQDHSEELQAVR